MILRSKINWPYVTRLSWPNLLYSLTVSLLAYFAYAFYKELFSWEIPLALVGTLGTALAILLGFRNGAAYDRWWEGRKIWGGIVNESRSWGRQVMSFVGPIYQPSSTSGEEVAAIQKTLIYRHLAWMHALRLQLRKQTDPSFWEEAVAPFLSEREYQDVLSMSNRSTQLVARQGLVLNSLFEQGLLDNFRQMRMDETLSLLYDYQGKAERIKGTPMVRPYHTWSRLFLNIFIFFLPFGLIPFFHGSGNTWLVIPVTVIVSWVFFVIYMFGEVMAEPFENIAIDVPLTAICNTIEIDLKEMSDDVHVPEKAEPIDGILM